MWYYKYKILAMDEIQNKEVYLKGIIAGETMADALEALSDYYGDTIINILTFTAVCETVFEFDAVGKTDDWEYEIKLRGV